MKARKEPSGSPPATGGVRACYAPVPSAMDTLSAVLGTATAPQGASPGNPGKP